MNGAVRRRHWRIRLRHWLRNEGPCHLAAARDTLLLAVVVLGTGALCFLLLGLGGGHGGLAW